MDDGGNPLPDTETFGEEYDCFLNAKNFAMNARSGGNRSGAIQGMNVDERFLNAKYEVWLPKKLVNFFQIPEKVKVMQEGHDIGVFEVIEKYNITVVGQIRLII